MCGCSRRATICASRSKRRTKSGWLASSGWIALTATSRPTAAGWPGGRRRTRPRRSARAADSRGAARPSARGRDPAEGSARGASWSSGEGSMPSSSASDPHGRGERGQRIGLSARAVQGEHQELPQPLAKGQLARQRLELGDELAVAPPARSAAIRSSSACRRSSSSPRSRPRARSPRGPLTLAPSTARAPRRTGPPARPGLPFANRASRRSHSKRAASNSRRDVQDVAGGAALEAVGSERPAKVGHVAVEGVPGSVGWLSAPDLVDQVVGGHQMVRPEEQVRQHRRCLGPPSGIGPSGPVTWIGPSALNRIREP